MSNYKVYCLTNNITGEKYIGVTKQKLYRRFKAGKGYKSNTKINKAILKYGWINFKHKVLQEFKVYHIWECIKGKRNQCGGYHWKRVGGIDNGNNN